MVHVVYIVHVVYVVHLVHESRVRWFHTADCCSFVYVISQGANLSASIDLTAFIRIKCLMLFDSKRNDRVPRYVTADCFTCKD